MIFVVLAVVSLAGASLHLLVARGPRRLHGIAERYLLYLLGGVVDAGGLVGFIGHTVMADEIARSIGWPAHNPFQQEVAVANLAFGVLGLLCLRFRGDFWFATVLGISVFLLGAAGVHLRDLLLADNRAPYNAGAVLYVDILIPLVLLGLLVAERRTRPSSSASTSR